MVVKSLVAHQHPKGQDQAGRVKDAGRGVESIGDSRLAVVFD